ncbi:diguanylate cyclase (GGDEF)-like protein [Sphingomonas zeicaulis]|uniref:putative bifunctional diguanylate cyclase/phosphodiesterase n=1 Tax=Sphingomonas zeicaulis TaxID=1632740 RepID=UPI003D22D46E
MRRQRGSDGPEERSDFLTDVVLGARYRDEIALAHMPVTRAFFAIGGLYFAVMTIAGLAVREGLERLVLVSSTSALAVGGLIGWLLCRQPRSYRTQEAMGFVANLAMLANLMLALAISFDQSKIVYFIIMITVYAAVGISLRIILLSAVMVVLGMAFHLHARPPDLGLLYGFVLFGAGLAAVGGWMLGRRALIEAIDARHGAEALATEARAQAATDSLTGVSNRRAFLDALEDAIDRLRREGRRFALVVLDLDGFKPVNEYHGHQVGDMILTDAGYRIARRCGVDGFAARLGGDEFALIVWSPDRIADPGKLAAEVAADMNEPFSCEGRYIRISASVGCLVCDDPDLSVDTAMERADFALRVAKRNRAGDAVVFDQRLEREMDNLFVIDQALRSCDPEEEFHLVYQPQYDMISGRTIGFEALARWQSPSIGIVTPDVFIKVAEQSSRISTLGAVLLRKALADRRDWPVSVTTAFNLSARDILSDAAIDTFMGIVAESGVPPQCIEFEVTETAMMPDFATATGNIRRLREAGHRIVLDDFGVGYSNLGRVQQFRFDKIKVDRSFVRDIAEFPNSVALIRSIFDLTVNLGLDCVVEGVETPEEMEALRRIGVGVVQGYMISRPMAAGAVVEFLHRESRSVDGARIGGVSS